MKKVLFIFLFILVVSSCKKDEGDIVSPGKREYTPKIITENYGNAKLVGFVKDKSGNPLSGVTVFFGEEKTLTGSDGRYQLNTLSAGSNKRIWFQKSGYASTQKLVDIKEALPNRIDASLFPIDKTEKITSDGGLIEGKDFSVEIEPGGFVFYDGTPVEEEVTAEVTAFLTSEDEFLNAFPGDFKGIREDRSETAIESFGFIDVVLKVESGEPVQLAEGVTAVIKIKAPEKAPATIPMWHYDEDKGKWIEEGIGTLDKGFYTAQVSHFTKWNWDRPYAETSKIIGRVIDNAGNPIEGASVVQKGITFKFQNSAITNEKGEFELLTPESNESTIEAQFDIYGSTIINYTTSANQGQVNNIGDIKINVSIDNVMPPFVSDNVLYITMGQTAKIRGKYFGNQKKQGYKLLLNGNEVVTKTWKNELIEFSVPNGIPEKGIIQIDRGGVLSREVNYIEGDWTCEIDGKIYDNNDLVIEGGKYHLNLFSKNLYSIPNCISNLKNLESLELTLNKLNSLPDNFDNLRDLEILKLGYNLFTIMPEIISNITNLQVLEFSYNKLSSLPESIGNLQNLEVLILDNNQLNSLPKSFGKLQNLKTLQIQGNIFNSLPESISNLQNLEQLYLKRNQINSLPESFGKLQNLKSLRLAINQLIAIPESFGDLQNLEVLILDDNQLNRLPESFGNLQNLKTLQIPNNILNILPESIGNLQNLEKLYIHNNQLTSLPETIGNLKELIMLRIDDNQLNSIPISIGYLKNLESLNLSNNRLNSIPESIGNLKNLESLILSNNRLHNIPKSIGDLQNLRSLSIGDNYLTSLPESIKNLKETLEILYIHNNKFSKEEKTKINDWLPNTQIYWYKI